MLAVCLEEKVVCFDLRNNGLNFGYCTKTALVQPTSPDLSPGYEWARRKMDVHLDTVPSELVEGQPASFRQGLICTARFPVHLVSVCQGPRRDKAEHSKQRLPQGK